MCIALPLETNSIIDNLYSCGSPTTCCTDTVCVYLVELLEDDNDEDENILLR
jgi:hypothetical protein